MPKSPEAMARILAYDATATRIWRDKRFTPGTRELALAMGLLLERAATRRNGREFWQALRELLGRDEIGRARMDLLLGEDAPRYEPHRPAWGRFCEAPRIRPRRAPEPELPKCLLGHHPHLGACRYTQVHVDASTTAAPPVKPRSETCGNPASWDLHVVEIDPMTGWHVDHWFCTRHKTRYAEVRNQVEAAHAAMGELPEPIPNTGGLLPCYFSTTWENVYTKKRPGWRPPVYGIAADDWPVPGRERPVRRPRLRVIPGGLAETEASA